MFERLLEAVRATTDGERTLRDLTAIAQFHRIQATPGYDEAAAWLESAIRGIGLQPERVPVPADGHTRAYGFPMPEGWRCQHARVTLHGAGAPRVIADYAVNPLSIVQRSTSAQGRWPLVHLADAYVDGSCPDLSGQVALVPWSGNQAHEHAVRAAGAAGLLTYGRRLMPPVRTAEHDPDSLNYTSFWWAEDRPRTWGAVVSPRLQHELLQRLRAGEPLEVECDIVTERYAGTIPLITTTIPGDRPGEVLGTGHLCHPRQGAKDKASGASAVL
ncbi:MAG: hypothetical protein K8R56_09160, partial [Candidatus Eisenbacteria bacterium]|nr:hypothetical protein [Candidatus Eisenbacteria bacterium]